MFAADHYVDWLHTVKENGGELAWIRNSHADRTNAGRRSRPDIIQNVLSSLAVKNCIKTMAVESNRTEQELLAEAKDIMNNMAHSFNLPSTRLVGYFVLKCLRRLLDKVMVNMEALREIRRISKNNPVVFMPTHRTYVDFLLISLLCYDQELRLPAICAGADFLTSKFVGEALRRCGAFFIRRSFGSDRLYWTLFTEYVQSHITNNECAIEFFVEGQRSRTSKSLYPKFGLVQVIAEPFLRCQVYDTVVVPVTINYDRLLESFLYGRELLGSPKPKETVSGLLKVRQILNQKFGNVFITFAEPISLRSYFAHIDRSMISFRPNAHYIYERNVKKTVATLAHEVVYVQNKHTILTLWPIAASIILFEMNKCGRANKKIVFEQTVKLYDLCRKFDLNVWISSSLEDDFTYYIQLYHDLFTNAVEDLHLLRADVSSSSDSYENALQEAIPNVVLSNSANPFAYAISDFAFVLLVCERETEYNTIEQKFTFLRNIYEREFVRKPNSAVSDLRIVVDQLVNSNILELQESRVLIKDTHAAHCLSNIIKPFLMAYSTIISIVAANHWSEEMIVQNCRQKLAQSYKEVPSNLSFMSSDLIKNVVWCLKSFGESDTQNSAFVIRDQLDQISGVNKTRSSL